MLRRGVWLCLVMLAATVWAQDSVQVPQPLTLKDAIRIALQKHPSVAIAKNQLEQAKARRQQAEARYFPTISPSATYVNQQTRTALPGFGTRVGSIDETRTDVSLRQTIFDSGQREISAAQARRSVESAEQAYREAVQQKVLSVTTAYYELLRRMALQKVAEANVQRAQQTVDVVKAQVEVGVAAQKDVLQAEAELANAQVSLIQARNQVRLAEASLRNELGIGQEVALQVAEVGDKEAEQLPALGSLEGYLQEAFAQRPDYQRQRISSEIQRLSLRLAQIQSGIQIQSDFTYGRRIDPDPGDTRSFTISASYPLFDGGAARAAVRESRAGYDSALQQMEQLKLTVRLDVEQAYLSRAEAQERLNAARKALEAAQVNYQAALESRKEGVSSLIEVINAQVALVNAETNYVQAIYDLLVADARLQRAVGKDYAFSEGGGQG
ncbi:MAG: TolC family protein [Chthonomonadetes bacterium]|nr:TolC family protein [Chthonomonadetes bacterium]